MLSSCLSTCTTVEPVNNDYVQVPETYLVYCQPPDGNLEDDRLETLLRKVDQNTVKHFDCFDSLNDLVDLLIEREQDL